MYPYGLIGNCQVSALISTLGSIDWLCMPQPDSPPVFGRLLDKQGGSFSIDSPDPVTTSQEYIKNTNVLVTRIRTEDGNEFKITDFCPRFILFGRRHRPSAVFRIVEPVAGNCRIRVRCSPVEGWSRRLNPAQRGNSHLNFQYGKHFLRLTTNMPLTYLCEEKPFLLQDTLYFALSWDTAIDDDLKRVSEEFLSQTIQYWKTWVKYCSTPTLFQEETIRSALTLKLHCFEDTGAILAALTSSLPEKIREGRNWDYRFCWLRDAYYVLSAFLNLGHFEDMEDFLKFLLNVAGTSSDLKPVYRLDQTLPLPERIHPGWSGYRDSSPVREHNQAAEHLQNDVYGEMMLVLAPIFHDERFHHLRTKEVEALVSRLAEKCFSSIGKPDAGLWELRGKIQHHAFTDLMCWAGLNRAQGIQEKGFLRDLKINCREAAAQALTSLKSAEHLGVLRTGREDRSLDSALLQLPTLRFPDSTLSKNTVEAISRGLSFPTPDGKEGLLYRYKKEDDFGRPQAAFILCSFWQIQALAKLGEMSRATELLKNTLTAANHLGLLSEHFDPSDATQLGNFPQCYSHVGVINAAFAVSPPWDAVY